MTERADQSQTHDFGTTWDGVPIVPGLVVFTNEMRVGVVEDHDYGQGWFDVRYATGGAVLQNAERVATHFEGRSAAAEWAAAQADA